LNNVATINFQEFYRILAEEFKHKKPSDALTQRMFERFKIFKFTDNGHEISRDQPMDILDFLLAMNFLARLVYEKKMRLMFELCDDDDDGCMRPAEILNMLQKVERIFAKECSKVDVDSTVLQNMIADKKAESKFQRIMC
jgi:Ca2+-binding EF-hand superfamily protein